jgi:GNAT superfamily N-acetyltransferase
MPLTFKFATAADIPALLRLRVAVDEEQTRRFGRDRWSTTINEKSIARGVPKAVYLHDVVVLPERQRAGIGSALIERAKVVAREWPADAIRLDAYDGTSGAGPFYRKCGFAEVGRAVYRRVPLVYYEFLISR